MSDESLYHLECRSLYTGGSYHPDVQAIKGGLTLFYGSHKKASINLKNMNIDDQNEVHFIAQHTGKHSHCALLPSLLT